MNQIHLIFLEDDPSDVELIQYALRKDGLRFVSHVAEREEDFMKCLSECEPDAILSDFNIPGFSGLKALEIAKQRFPDIPFIFVSGVIGEELAIQTFKQGASDCINKNRLATLPNSLRRALEEALQRRRRREAEEALLESCRRTHDILIKSIKAMATAMEFRDPYTSGHQWRTSALAVAIAKNLGCGDEMIEGISLAAIVHDIGKIYVPAEILMRPRKLTSAEMGLVRLHPEAGYTILKDIDFPWPIAEMVYQHHERIDGSGYPRGLRGKEILFEAKIIAVADVVEAMSSHRHYRASLGLETALEEIKKNAGVSFDTDIASACLALTPEIEKMWKL